MKKEIGRKSFIKRAVEKKLVCSVLICTMLLSCFTANVSYANTSIEPKAWIQKLSGELQKKMEAIKEKNDETIPVSIWYADIDQESVDEKVEEETGLTRESLDTIVPASDTEVLDMANAVTQDTEVPEEVQEYLDKTAEQREQASEATQTFIEKRREIAREEYCRQYEELQQHMELPEERVIFRSQYAPMVIVSLSYNEIYQIAQCVDVESVDLYEERELVSEGTAVVIDPEIEDRLDYALNLSQGYATLARKTGLTGSGVKVGILEQGDARGFEYNGGTFPEHWGVVYGIVHKIAPDADINLRFEGIDPKTWHLIFKLIEEMLNEGVQVFNFSWGLGSDTDKTSYTFIDKWMDHVVYEHNVTVVNSAGNLYFENDGDVSDEADDKITSPGMAYNVITVGGSNGTEMYEKSSGNYRNGCFKPDLIAQADYNDVELEDGTSYAAPAVTATVALMLELNPALAANPQAVKAILMAGCHQKATGDLANILVGTGGCDLRKWQGAGILDLLKTISIVRQKQYGVGTLTAEETSVSFIQPPYGASRMNVNLAWLRKSKLNHTDILSNAVLGMQHDLDLFLYSEDTGRLLAKSVLRNSSTEMLSHSNLTSGFHYRIQMERYSDNEEAVRYGYAWSTNEASVYDTLLPTEIYWIRNKQTGQYLEQKGTAGTSNIVQNYYQGGETQQWMVQKKNGLNTLKSGSLYGAGSLIGGSAIDSLWSQATIGNPGTSEIKFQENTDGSYAILDYNNSTGISKALTPYNNADEFESKMAWKAYTGAGNQRWYIEKLNYKRGDLDLNGVINSNDLELLTQFLSGSVSLSGIKQYLADMNNDGLVNAVDKTLLQTFTSVK